MSSVINIGIDLDGVCANFGLVYSAIANKIIGPQCPIINNETEILYWEWEKWYPITKENDEMIWSYIRNSENFWTSVPVLNKDNFIYMTKKLQNIPNVNIYFITTRIETRGLTMRNQSVLWLTQHGWRTPQVIGVKTKGTISAILKLDYFIDDKSQNVFDVKTALPNCDVFVHSAAHNEDVSKKMPSIKRVANLTEFTNEILKKLEKA
jgi:hypothetical protein